MPILAPAPVLMALALALALALVAAVWALVPVVAQAEWAVAQVTDVMRQFKKLRLCSGLFALMSRVRLPYR
ncbi:hypothetical protein [Stutzerimonas stutzeri]|uniref:hypothetical protein n=1 Tax=Stutzerimonas stutzeri TaxID=316 RepID=UPI0015E48518|nr:hypothetical protein [Stutzerimonas stutzeri]MBA1264081.1 hypothetical protein [Stutzerimonas stutzeri]